MKFASSAIRVAAVDLGATSGRIMAGTVSADALHLEEAHRFATAESGSATACTGTSWAYTGRS